MSTVIFVFSYIRYTKIIKIFYHYKIKLNYYEYTSNDINSVTKFLKRLNTSSINRNKMYFSLTQYLIYSTGTICQYSVSRLVRQTHEYDSQVIRRKYYLFLNDICYSRLYKTHNVFYVFLIFLVPFSLVLSPQNFIVRLTLTYSRSVLVTDWQCPFLHTNSYQILLTNIYIQTGSLTLELLKLRKPDVEKQLRLNQQK